MRFLITRPEADAKTLARQLGALGHDYVIEPLLEMNFLEPEIEPDRYRAFLATSANGIRAVAGLKAMPALRQLDLFAVGPASAEEGRKNGFQSIHIAGGDVSALAAMVASTLKPSGKPLLHVSGAAAAGDLKGDLEGRGFNVERVIGYEARARETFSSGVRRDLTERRIDAVLLYSPRTAAIFIRLLASAGLEHIAAHLTFFCLSRAVADKLGQLGDVRSHIAASPDQASLLKLINNQS